jgi:hypothetical protein
MSKPRGALPIERGRYRSMSFYGFELVGSEVSRRVELGYFTIESRECLTQLWRGSLTADSDRTGVVQRVVVDPDSLPQTIVDESLLELRSRVV